MSCLIERVHFPAGPGIRVDSHIYSGYTVSHFYDSLIAKIIAHAPTRKQAIRAMLQALNETHIQGIKTNITLHQDLLTQNDFQVGKLHIHF